MKIELTGVSVGAPNRCFATEDCPQYADMAVRVKNVPVHTCALCFKTKIESGEWEIEKPKSEKFSIADLIAEIGVENVKFQWLDSSLTDIKLTKKDGTKITFCTTEMTPNDVVRMDGSKLGVVLWLDRTKTKAILERIQR